MPDVSFGNLVTVSGIAFLAPLLIGLAPRLRLPSVVLELVIGIVVGPAGLGGSVPISRCRSSRCSGSRSCFSSPASR